MPALSVSQLIREGATYNNSDIEVVGWIVDRFEHRAIYETEAVTIDRHHSQGIWLSGALPERKTIRGDGPLHGLRVKLSGKFHWQPRSGTGHMGLWPAWIGAKTHEVIDPKAEGAPPNAGSASAPPASVS